MLCILSFYILVSLVSVSQTFNLCEDNSSKIKIMLSLVCKSCVLSYWLSAVKCECLKFVPLPRFFCIKKCYLSYYISVKWPQVTDTFSEGVGLFDDYMTLYSWSVLYNAKIWSIFFTSINASPKNSQTIYNLQTNNFVPCSVT